MHNCITVVGRYILYAMQSCSVLVYEVAFTLFAAISDDAFAAWVINDAGELQLFVREL